MKVSCKTLIHYIYPVIIFLFSFLLRLYFFTGFILGDDAEELSAMLYILDNGPEFHTALHLRFALWIFNVIFFKLFGVSEFSFFLPTWLMSASLGVIGYFILIFFKYPKNKAFLASLFIASAPFEILIGVVRANDLIFSWFLVLALFFFLIYEKRQLLQGAIVAFLLWLAFYVKLWVVYLFPALFVYYLVQGLKNKNWQGGVSFLVVTLLLHGIMGIIWKKVNGYFFPFIVYHSATYPVAKSELINLFQVYPKMIFFGSEFGTTLFGYIPYLLIFLLLLKLVLSKSKKFFKYLKFDKLDIYLLVFYSSFFLLLNFFPNTFKFDQYYSAPRIFRYLTPISFPMTLHVAKMLLDFNKVLFKKISLFKKYGYLLIFISLIAINLYQADIATKPGQIYYRSLKSIVEDVKKESPPMVIAESWLSFFLREIYLKDWKERIVTVPNYTYDDAKDYEEWLKENEPNFPYGSMLITGLGSYVHYGCHNCGFRLRLFNSSLNSNWKLYREYEMLSYLPVPEPARLWIWTGNKKD